jgi:excisionase family DNA binding protein
MSVVPIGPNGRAERLTFTVAEAAGLLGISSDLAYELIARRELPALRLGRRIVVPRLALEAILDRASPVGE